MSRTQLEPSIRSMRSAEQRCEHPGCDHEGVYRAPKGRDRLRDYYWFCLAHVRAYNQEWNFFRGMSDLEVEAIRRRDTVWERPSWPLGGNIFRAETRLRDHLSEKFGGAAAADGARVGRNRPASDQERALEVLGLGSAVSFTEIKARYKKLAKTLHPDANGGDTAAEERFKVVNQAYATLRKCYVG